jgi:hypothetical protein
MIAPTLDGKHRAVATVEGRNYHHLVFVDPCAEFTANDGHHDAGEFYHVGLVHEFGVEFTKKPCRAEFVPELLAWWHLDYIDLKELRAQRGRQAQLPVADRRRRLGGGEATRGDRGAAH